eukprot:1248315-Pleurochrysis_carterae.AAC.1
MTERRAAESTTNERATRRANVAGGSERSQPASSAAPFSSSPARPSACLRPAPTAPRWRPRLRRSA